MTATSVTCGAISLSNRSHLSPISDSILDNPVMLPPGWSRLVTKPWPTGSMTFTNTIGMVRVAALAAFNAKHQDIRRKCDLRRRDGLQCVALGQAVIDPHVAAVRPSELLKPLQKCGDPEWRLDIGARKAHQHADTFRTTWLLRARRQRPRNANAAE
jgi:hypothetical protein